jgi:hypothetical protein
MRASMKLKASHEEDSDRCPVFHPCSGFLRPSSRRRTCGTCGSDHPGSRCFQARCQKAPQGGQKGCRSRQRAGHEVIPPLGRFARARAGVTQPGLNFWLRPVRLDRTGGLSVRAKSGPPPLRLAGYRLDGLPLCRPQHGVAVRCGHGLVLGTLVLAAVTIPSQKPAEVHAPASTQCV